MNQQPQDKPQGAGSIWNVNSWHWEQKNYTEVAKKIITTRLENQVYQRDGITVILEKVQKIKGDAEISIRKGKQIITYSFDMELDWSAENEEDNANGTFNIHEVNESDLDYEITQITAKEKTKISDKAKEFLRKHLKAELDKIFGTLTAELASQECDTAKLEADKQKRADALAAMRKAQEEKGQEKQRIFEEQREKELKMKEEFSKVKM